MRPRPLTRSEGVVAVAVATIVSTSIRVLGIGEHLAVTSFALLVCIGYLVWWIAGRVSDRLPAVGAVWARPQWTMFAVAGSAVALLVIGQLLGLTEALNAVSPIGAGITLLMFVGTAVLDGRDG